MNRYRKGCKSAIENMTGLEASDVNISIAEVEIEQANNAAHIYEKNQGGSKEQRPPFTLMRENAGG